MKKTKITLMALLSTVAATCCAFALAACGEEPVEKHTIKWEYTESLVTVAAEGYSTLPTELEENTVVKFSTTAVNGYTASASGSGATVSKDGDSGNNWKFTVAKKDVTVKVTANKVINDITVTYTGTKDFLEDQQVDKKDIKVTANYVLGDEDVTDFTVSYKNGGNAFVVGETAFTVSFGGKSKDVTVNKVKACVAFESAELVLENDTPVLKVNGKYNGDGDKETAKTTVESYIHDAMERGSWSEKAFTPDATINDDNSFVLKLTVSGMTSGHMYFFHVKDGADGSNLSCEVINPSATMGKDNNDNNDIYKGLILDDEKALVTSTGAKYYCGLCEDWNPATLMIHVEDPTAPELTNATLEIKDGKPCLVINGKIQVATAELGVAKIKAAFPYLDLINQGSGSTGWEAEEGVSDGTLYLLSYERNEIIPEVDATNGTFKIYIDLSAAKADQLLIMMHTVPGNSGGNFSLAYAEDATSIEVGGFTYSAYKNEFTDWKAGVLFVEVTATAAE